jgi:hypothetical protein
MKIGARNLLDLKGAWDIVHFFRHLRNCCFRYVTVGLKMNPLLGQTLDKVHAEEMSIMYVTNLDKLDAGLIAVRKLRITDYITVDNAHALKFIYEGRKGGAELLTIDNGRAKTAIDGIVKVGP